MLLLLTSGFLPTWRKGQIGSCGELGPRGHAHKVLAELGDDLLCSCIRMVFSGKALGLGTLKMLLTWRHGALNMAMVGQAEIPALLALGKAKRGLGRQGSSLTNWTPSEQCGEWWPAEAALTEPFFLK